MRVCVCACLYNSVLLDVQKECGCWRNVNYLEYEPDISKSELNAFFFQSKKNPTEMQMFDFLFGQK